MKRISFIHRLLDLVSPRICAVCGRRLAVTEDIVCASCNLHLPRTGFSVDAYDNEMARLFWVLLPIERASALIYNQPHSQAAAMIYDMKYHNQPETAELMGSMMADEMMGDGFFDGIDLLIPVPLTRKRERQRGYNQSYEMAKGISEKTGIPIASDVVQRVSFTESQTHKNRYERQENVKGSFRLTNGTRISGKHVMLVDDVVTTGATIIACGQELVKAGNVKISVVCLGFSKE